MSDHDDTAIQLARPIARCEVTVRQATLDDWAFIDQLQKMHTHMVGWMAKKALEGYIEGGHVLIAEGERDAGETSGPPSPEPVGYVIAKDQYMKRDDVGIVYQLNVLPLVQRSLIGATLIQSVFERAAYGCRLFCCWCAQDIAANYFWESIGFVPLAFRTGSRDKQRIHIFWQCRVRGGDDDTPWWYPYQTQAGAVREDRLVLPIPPDTHWRDAKPVVLPDVVETPEGDALPEAEQPKQLPGGAPVRTRPESTRGGPTRAQRVAVMRSKSKHLQGLPPGKAAVMTGGGLKYIDRGDAAEDDQVPVESAKKKSRRKRKPRAKHDPKLAASARELRDRYLEEVNSDPGVMLGCGKYDVSRMIEGDASVSAPARSQHLLE